MESALIPLIAGAVALLLIISGIVLWINRSRAAKRAKSTPIRPPDDLRSLGIVDIRPMKKAAAPEPETAVAIPDTGADQTDAPRRSEEDDVARRIPPNVEQEEPGQQEPRTGSVTEAEGAADTDDTDSPLRRATATHETTPLKAGRSVENEAPPRALEASNTAAANDEDPSVLLDDGSALRDGAPVVLEEEARSALAETVSEELNTAIAEVEGASETTPLRPTRAAAFGEVDVFGDIEGLPAVRLPDPRDFEDDLDLPVPLPGADLALIRPPVSPALAHLIEAMWSGLRAQTIALLRHDASALRYVVEALKSDHPAVVNIEGFSSAGSALRSLNGLASLEETPVLLRGAALDALGYYSDSDAIGRAYIQPLIQSAAPSLLLVVDMAPDTPSYSRAEKGLLRHFASALAHLAAQEIPAWFEAAPPTDASSDLPAESAPVATPSSPTAEASSPDTGLAGSQDDAPGTVDMDGRTDMRESSAGPDEHGQDVAEAEAHPTTSSDESGLGHPDDAEEILQAATQSGTEASPVSRRVIVAEEMERARARQYPLALALVHHADAEVIAQEGSEAVDRAEAVLSQHLAHSLELADGRIEPFGELLYGVFYYGRAADIEAWIELVRSTPARTGETIPIAIGVALYGERHQTSDQLRADAVQALADAYDAQVGCVILE